MKSFLRKCSFLFFSEGQLLFVNIVFFNHVCQPRHFAPRINGWPVIQLCSLHYRRYCLVPYPQFSRRTRVFGACKLYSFVLGLRRPEKREKITPVMQAKGNPSEKMANFFRERLCIVNWVEWLWNPSDSFVICFCGPESAQRTKEFLSFWLYWPIKTLH